MYRGFKPRPNYAPCPLKARHMRKMGDQQLDAVLTGRNARRVAEAQARKGLRAASAPGGDMKQTKGAILAGAIKENANG